EPPEDARSLPADEEPSRVVRRGPHGLLLTLRQAQEPRPSGGRRRWRPPENHIRSLSLSKGANTEGDRHGEHRNLPSGGGDGCRGIPAARTHRAAWSADVSSVRRML